MTVEDKARALDFDPHCWGRPRTSWTVRHRPAEAQALTHPLPNPRPLRELIAAATEARQWLRANLTILRRALI